MSPTLESQVVLIAGGAKNLGGLLSREVAARGKQVGHDMLQRAPPAIAQAPAAFGIALHQCDPQFHVRPPSLAPTGGRPRGECRDNGDPVGRARGSPP